MIAFKEIAFTGYPVTDIARATAFYEGVLGLKPGTRFEHEGRQWIEYDIGTGTLAISNMAQEMWKPSSDGPAIVLEVVDFDAAMAHVREAGTRVLVEPMDSGPCRLAIVADPDGNSLGLHQRKA